MRHAALLLHRKEIVMEAIGPVDCERERPVQLTRREIEVLWLTMHGKKRPEIAADLGIRPDTVKKHADSARGKLGGANNAHAVAIAIHLGIINYGTHPNRE
jgi:DNA-binding CsgD family transcriptional regulator